MTIVQKYRYRYC